MTTKEMQDTFNEFRSKYPGYKGCDLKTQREILDGTKVIVRRPGRNFMVMTKEEVAPGGRLAKMNAETKRANALNRKMKKDHFNSLPEDFKSTIGLLNELTRIIGKR